MSSIFLKVLQRFLTLSSAQRYSTGHINGRDLLYSSQCSMTARIVMQFSTSHKNQ